MSENKSNTTGGMIIAALVVIAIIYYFLKFLGEFLGYLFILAGIGYFIYSLISKRKSGNIVNLTDAKLVPYTAKLLGVNLAILFVTGFVFLGLGSWLNPNYTYCECEEFGEGAVLRTVGINEDDPLYAKKVKFNDDGVAACKDKIIDDLDLDMEASQMSVYYLYEVAGEMCKNGSYKKNNGDIVYDNTSRNISIISSIQTLYQNMKYTFGWGRDEQLAELEKEEKELFGDKLAPKTPETKTDSAAEVTEPDAEGEEESHVPELFEINDPDGYSNLRVSPRGKIIRKVMKGEKFEVMEKGESNSKVKLSDGTMGYIHNSRIISSQ